MLTLSGVSQLSTHYSGISNSPEVITHSAPHTVHADLHSAFVCNVSSCQSQLTSYTWGCIIEQKYIETKLSSYCYFPILDHASSQYQSITEYLHSQHQHQQSGGSCGRGLVC